MHPKSLSGGLDCSRVDQSLLKHSANSNTRTHLSLRSNWGHSSLVHFSLCNWGHLKFSGQYPVTHLVAKSGWIYGLLSTKKSYSNKEFTFPQNKNQNCLEIRFWACQEMLRRKGKNILVCPVTPVSRPCRRLSTCLKCCAFVVLRVKYSTQTDEVYPLGQSTSSSRQQWM